MRLPGNLRAELLLGLSLRGAGAVSSFALVWMIARLFGAEVVGLYQLGLVTVTLASLFVSLGLDFVLVREVAGLLREERKGDARAVYLRCRAVVLRHGIPACLVVGALAIPLGKYVLGEPRAAAFIAVFAPAVLLLALLKIGNAMLRTTRRIVLSQSLEGVFYSTFAMLVLAGAWVSDRAVFPLLPAVAWIGGLALATAVSLIVIRRTTSDWPDGSSAIRSTAGAQIAAAPMLTSGGDWLVLLMISAFGTVADTGVYRVAFQICLLFQLVNASFATMAGPHLARAASAGEPDQIRQVVRSAGAIGLGLCLPLAIAGLFAPGWILGLFGPEFRTGALALQLLVVAQVVNVGFGPVGTGLVMMGRERFVLGIEIAATLVSVATAAATFGSMGLAGPALGVLAASVIRNGGNYIGLARAVRAMHALGQPGAEPPPGHR